MTAQPLAPVIPSSGAPASQQRSRSAAARRLPLASRVPVPSLPEDVVYGIARIDSSGRICERALITALGWSGGDLLTVTADAGADRRRDPGGMVTLPARAHITIPAALRRRCGLEAGNQVLLAAHPDQDSLAALFTAAHRQPRTPQKPARDRLLPAGSQLIDLSREGCAQAAMTLARHLTCPEPMGCWAPAATRDQVAASLAASSSAVRRPAAGTAPGTFAQTGPAPQRGLRHPPGPPHDDRHAGATGPSARDPGCPAVRGGSAGSGLVPARPVVGGAPGRVAQHLVGLGQGTEPGRGRGVTRPAVRVLSRRPPPPRPRDLPAGGTRGTPSSWYRSGTGPPSCPAAAMTITSLRQARPHAMLLSVCGMRKPESIIVRYS